jgi:ABC-type lipoprotein export system ATPase subunit
VLELDAVSKEYLTDSVRVQALRDVSLRVEPGEFVAIVGRSGCGKSTLLNLAGAMDFPTAGDVRIDGESTRLAGDGALTRLRRKKIGFVFQSFQLLASLSAVENVELPLLLAGVSGARRIAMDRLRWVEMDALHARLPHQMSGGEMQRVAIARALVHNPRLLLADEPTGNLDTATSTSILRLLQRIVECGDTSVLMATHSAEAAAAAGKIVRMRDGRTEP